MRKYIGLFSIVLYFILSGSAYAQNDSVTILKPYQPSISDAKKINFNPNIVTENIERPDMEYQITSKKINTDIQLSKIDQVKLRMKTNRENLKNSHIKAGFGNYSTAYGELFVHSKQDEKKLLGLHMKHLSSQGEIEGFPISDRSQNLIELYGARYGKTHTLGADIVYDRNVHHFYGFDTAAYPGVADKDLRQRFNMLKGNLFLESNYKSPFKLNHKIEAGYHYLYDLYNTAENHFYADFEVNKRVDWFKSIDNQTFGIEGGYEYYNSGDSVVAFNTQIFNVTPYMLVKMDPFELRIGPKFTVSPYYGPVTGDTTTNVKIYPVVDVKLHIVKDHLTLFAGLRGDYERIGYHTVIEENPYVNPTITPTFTNHVFEAFGGIKASIGNVLDINAGIYNSNIDNMIFFVIDSTNTVPNKFKYETDSIQLTRVHADISLNITKDFEMTLAGNYYNYTMEALKAPWNRPEYDATLNVQYRFLDKYKVSLKTQFIGKRPYTFDVATDAILYNDEIIDIGLGLEYKHNDNLGAFLELKNFMGRYSYWNNYPSYGFNGLIGVKYSF